MKSAAHPDAIERWRAFRAEPFRSLAASPMPDPLIPLHETPHFDHLSAEEKRALYLGYIQFTAEFFIFLESLLLFAMESLRSHEKARRLASEELLHSNAFRAFLRQERILPPATADLILRRRLRTRKAMIAVVRRVPLAMALPGAKIEAYSVSYARYLKTLFGSVEANTWMKLNWTHLLDEVHHVPFEFDIHNEVYDSLSWPRKVETVIGVAAFYLLLQWILVSSALLLGWNSLAPGRPFRRARLSLAILRWASRQFLPARQMREAMRSHFRSRKPRAGLWLWYVAR